MLQGKSSINALGKTFGADIEVVDLGIDESEDTEGEINLTGIINRKLMKAGTRNIVEGSAMDYITAVKAVETGIEIADIFAKKEYNLFATGEMGIGNTTTSSAVLKVLKFFPKRRVVFRCFIGIRQLLQGGNQGFGDIKPAVFAEKALLVGRVVVFHYLSLLIE